MRIGSLIALTTAIFVAIGVALVSSVTSDGTHVPDDFDEIYYVRNVEHNRPWTFGDCPLGREVVVQRTGRLQISWYVQRADIHGCVRAFDLGPSDSIDAVMEAPVIARKVVMLNQSSLQELLKRLESLRWQADWSGPKNMDESYSTDCKRTTDALPGRSLAIAAPGPKISVLSIFDKMARQPAEASCATNEIANAKVLDTAVAPFAPLLPAQYHIRPAIAERLNRER
ncbi:hypothetical protein SAMN05428974_3704 [Sphingopyxis sp. YR583]|nr:hypothetical protein SAMN05428974_3704 [Sphingopyxis sp. YR583]